ncbi:hypothetical protein MMC27_000117 [Xylographa pallens]|nr:hypothetical protein [Xylographa pallens]
MPPEIAKTTPSNKSEDGSQVEDGLQVEVGLQLLAGDSYRLIQAIQKLKHLGVEDFGISLPKICVVGDQSTGKSSLIEAISEIKVPRDTGTCTRCPIEINLSEDKGAEGQWRCDVYLFKTYAYMPNGKSGSRCNGTKAESRWGPWKIQDPDDQHFAAVSDKEKVGDVIRRAQLAILNPGTSQDRYKPGVNLRTPTSLEVKFSPNCVRVEISGPGLKDLTFYDLPGIISNAEHPSENYLISLVKELVVEYVGAKNCVNVLALPMTHDVANSAAAGLISDVGAQERTMGVLTKPDCVQSGQSLDQWTSLIINKGYHVVMNHPDTEMKHATARAKERDFFQSKAPYATDLKRFRDRYGTMNLQSALSGKLFELITDCLPQIEIQLVNRAVEVNTELDGLPKPPAGNLTDLIRDLVSDFCNDLGQQVVGGRPEYPFEKASRDLMIGLREKLSASRPRLSLPTTAPDLDPRSSFIDLFVDQDDYKAPISLVSDDEDMPAGNQGSAAKKRADENRARSTIETGNGKRRVGDAFVTPTPSKYKKRKLANVPPLASITELATRFSLPGIREMIGKAYVGLQGSVDPRVSEDMSIRSMGHWRELTTEFLDETHSLTQKLVLERLGVTFSPYQPCPLYYEAIDVCKQFLAQAMDQQRITVERILSIESYKAMTFDDDIMRDRQIKALAGLDTARRNNRATLVVNTQEAHNTRQAGTQNRAEKIAKAVGQLGPDPFEQELGVMATTRAYYECAVSRMADSIGQGINYDFFRKLKSREELRPFMIRKLGMDAANARERSMALLAVDAKIEDRRAQLKKDQLALSKALQWVQETKKDTQYCEADLTMDDT